MKKIPYATFAVAIAIFAFAVSSPTASAIPTNKVPGSAYFDGRFENNYKSKSASACCEKIKNCIARDNHENRCEKVKKASDGECNRKPRCKK